jgi:hypothetical protein
METETAKFMFSAGLLCVQEWYRLDAALQQQPVSVASRRPRTLARRGVLWLDAASTAVRHAVYPTHRHHKGAQS